MSYVANQISAGGLIVPLHLVPQCTFVFDVGTQDTLRSVRKSVDDFDMGTVDAIMSKTPIPHP